MKEQWELELDEMESLEAEFGQEESLWDQTKDAGLTALDGAGRVLDYVGGHTRTGINGAIDGITNNIDALPNTDLYREGDFDRAMVGKAVGYDENIERSGGEDSYTNAALGMGLDIATDPTTYLSFGASAIPKALKAMKMYQASNAASKLKMLTRAAEVPTKALGKSIYKLPFRKMDKRAVDYAKNTKGLNPENIMKPTDIMYENGMRGTTGKLETQYLDKLEDLSHNADDIIQSNANVPMNINNATSKLKSLINKRKANPLPFPEFHRANKSADDVLNNSKELYEYRPTTSNTTTTSSRIDTGLVDDVGTPISREELSSSTQIIQGNKAGTVGDLDGMRKALNSDLNTHFKGNSPYTSDDILFKNNLRSGVRQEQIDAINRLNPGQGDALALANKERGVLLSGMQGANQDFARLGNRPIVTKPDAWIAGSALGGDTKNLAILGAGKALDFMKSPWATSNAGQLMKKGAESGVNDVMLRQLMMMQSKQHQPIE